MTVLGLSVGQAAGVVRVVRVHGEVDRSNIGPLEWILDQQLVVRPKMLVVDVSELSQLGAAGAGALGRIAHHAREDDIEVCLVGAARRAVTVPLEASGVAELYQTCHTVDECCPDGSSSYDTTAYS